MLEIAIRARSGATPLRNHVPHARLQQPGVGHAQLLVHVVVGVVPLGLRIRERACKTSCEGRCMRRSSCGPGPGRPQEVRDDGGDSEEHTSELQSLMRISYAVFCLKKKKQPTKTHTVK